MASGSTGGRDYSLVELFAIKFVLADVLIIALLLLAGPVYAILATALIVVGGSSFGTSPAGRDATNRAMSSRNVLRGARRPTTGPTP